MRVLFFTAAAVAACMANLGKAVKLTANESDIAEYDDNTLAQTYFWGNSDKDKKKDDEKKNDKNKVDPKSIYMTANAATGEFATKIGAAASAETNEAVTKALGEKMRELAMINDQGEKQKLAIMDMKKAKEAADKAGQEARETDAKAKKMMMAAKEDAMKSAELAAKRLGDKEALIKAEENKLKKMEQAANDKKFAVSDEIAKVKDSSEKVAEKALDMGNSMAKTAADATAKANADNGDAAASAKRE